MEKAPDNKALAGSDIPFPWQSEFSSRLTMGDICYYAPGMLNKIGKEGKTSWDSFAYALMMGHNVNSHIVSVQRANQLMDIEIAKNKGKINWRAWKKVKASDKSDEYSEWVPRNILYFDNFVEDLFNTTTKAEAFEMIEDGMSFLLDIEGTRSQDGKSKNRYHALFDVEEVSHEDEVDMSARDDDQLNTLSNEFDE